MLKAKNQIQNGAVAQLGERFNGVEETLSLLLTTS
jgi:hypothetical protein